MARNYLAGTGALLAAIAALTFSGPARASINIGTTDASDGAFNPTADVQVDLSQAVTGTWNQDNTANAGKGVYDPVKWAVVFKYSSVNIPAGVTVTFKNHPSGAPVVWLVQGGVSIAGMVNLDGKAAANVGILTEAGPGGFEGGGGYTSTSHPSGSGHGPGGGGQSASELYREVAGSYATQGMAYAGHGFQGPIYGNSAVIPLIGGSGGTGYYASAYDGGGGGGAFLLCSANALNITGTLSASGGNPSDAGGSGGAIRLIADTVTGSGILRADGSGVGTVLGGEGRIRIEAETLAFTGSSSPAASTLQPVVVPVIWPEDTTPSLAIAQIAGKPAPADPHAVLDSADHYATVASVQPIVVRLDAKNVPLNWNVILRVVPFSGPDFTVNAINVSGDATASVWEATVTTPMGASAFQARASKP